MQVKTKQKLFGALAHLVNSVETSMTAITSYERAVAYGRRARKFCVTLALLEYQYCKDDFWKCLAACAQQTAPLSSSIAALKCYWKSEWSENNKIKSEQQRNMAILEGICKYFWSVHTSLRYCSVRKLLVVEHPHTYCTLHTRGFSSRTDSFKCISRYLEL